MPLFGAHMSVAGGYHNAIVAATAQNCGTVQLFTKNANQWQGKELTEGDVTLFRQTLRKSKLRHTMAQRLERTQRPPELFAKAEMLNSCGDRGLEQPADFGSKSDTQPFT